MGVANQLEMTRVDNYKSDREMSVCELQNEVARYERDYFHAFDEYSVASTAVQKDANATVEIGASARPMYLPGGRAPRSRLR